MDLDVTEIVAALEIDPELRLHPEKCSKDIGRFGGDGALAFYNFTNRGTQTVTSEKSNSSIWYRTFISFPVNCFQIPSK